jgi:hypothetical protein
MLLSKASQSDDEPLSPGLGQVSGQRYGQKNSYRFAAHCGNVTESTGYAAMPNRFGGMPITPEMDAFQAEVCCDEKILVRGQPQYSAVVSDTCRDPDAGTLRLRTVRIGGQTSDFIDQCYFGKRHRPTIPPVICPMVTHDWRS